MQSKLTAHARTIASLASQPLSSLSKPKIGRARLWFVRQRNSEQQAAARIPHPLPLRPRPTRMASGDLDDLPTVCAPAFPVSDWLRRRPRASFAVADRGALPQAAELLRCWSNDATSYSYCGAQPAVLLPLPLPCELDSGVASFVPKSELAKPGVEVVVRAALAAGTSPFSASVLTFRSNLNKLGNTLCDARTAWTVDACLVRSTLFLDIVKPELQGGEDSPEQRRFQAWGYVFEARCTGAAVADANQETSVLVRTSVGSVSVLLGAEIDCYDAESLPPGAPCTLPSLRELKTFKQPAHAGAWRTLYRSRHPKWWLQSHLAGVTQLLLGARDDQGVVRAVHAVPTADLPRLSAANGEPWSPSQTLALTQDVLAWFRSVAKAQADGLHLRFVYAPENQAIEAHIVWGGRLHERLKAVLPNT